MHHSSQELEAYKRELILEYVLPAFDGLVSLEVDKFEEIAKRCHLQKAVKHQRLETPGSASLGFLWFSIGAMCHSYFYNAQKRRESGTIIYKRRQFIFNGDSLLYGLDRPDYVQILEPGEILCIRYEDVLWLMQAYTDINQAIRTLASYQGMYFRQQSAYRALSSVERVQQLRKAHPTFIKCASLEIQAIHTYLSLKQYSNIVRLLR